MRSAPQGPIDLELFGPVVQLNLLELNEGIEHGDLSLKSSRREIRPVQVQGAVVLGLLLVTFKGI